MVLCKRARAFLPKTAIDQVVPFRDEIMDRAARGHAAQKCARMAKRNAANPCTGPLLGSLSLQMEVKLVPVLNPFQCWAIDGSSRKYSIKPVGFPMGVVARVRSGSVRPPPTRARSLAFFFKGCHQCLFAAHPDWVHLDGRDSCVCNL